MKSKISWDPVMFWLAAVATVVGLLAIYDSGYARSAADGIVVPREFRNQLFSTVAALAGGAACWFVRRKDWRVLAWIGYALTIVALVFVKLFGTEINGATRWIDLKYFTVQPAEFAKFAVILLLASILATRKPTPKVPRAPQHWAERIDWVWVPRIVRSWPLMLVMVAAVLVLIEPDLATAMVIVVVSGFMLFIGGVSRGSIASLVLVCVLCVSFLVIKEPYRMGRFLNHGDRWTAANIDDSGYQTTQSEAAMASGGWFGRGLGEGRAKHKLPAPTTDFIMATVAEEVGFVGVMAIMALMGGLVYRMLNLARGMNDRFGKFVLYGTATWIGVQSCTNIVMANGFAPPIGVPMPFVSAGGSSLVALWMAIGVCQSVLRENPEEAKEVATSGDRRWHRRPRVSRA